MGFQLAPIDRWLKDRVIMTLTGGRSGAPRIPVKFQFPLVIESDSKGVEFRELTDKFFEPLAMFKGSKAREIRVSWQYVVTGGEWGVKEIEKTVKEVRSYFYASAMEVYQPKAGLIINFQAYNEVGKRGSTFSFRSEGVDVSFEGPIIEIDGGTWPLITKLSMTIKMWTAGIAWTSLEEEFGEEEAVRMVLPGLEFASELTPPWF